MRIVDARSGAVVQIGRRVENSPDRSDWYTVVGTRWRSLLTRIVTVKREDGSSLAVVAPVKLFPRVLYGSDFPVDDPWVLLLPS